MRRMSGVRLRGIEARERTDRGAVDGAFVREESRPMLLACFDAHFFDDADRGEQTFERGGVLPARDGDTPERLQRRPARLRRLGLGGDAKGLIERGGSLVETPVVQQEPAEIDAIPGFFLAVAALLRERERLAVRLLCREQVAQIQVMDEADVDPRIRQARDVAERLVRGHACTEGFERAHGIAEVAIHDAHVDLERRARSGLELVRIGEQLAVAGERLVVCAELLEDHTQVDRGEAALLGCPVLRLVLGDQAHHLGELVARPRVVALERIQEREVAQVDCHSLRVAPLALIASASR
jgi:hypothetical protein